ncbi:MAG: glycosyltransferase family A protein [Leptospirillia bacterium]
MHTPTIVVAAYNRPDALSRLLGSLAAADFPDGGGVPLVISIDRSDSDAVADVARAFDWAHGPKEVICHPENLGLREHILRCGDLSQRGGGVIVLEDDLFVSRHFYDYVRRAMDHYGEDDRVAGISLYSHRTNPYLREPFVPVEDGSDVFFLQLASSWGQAWSALQWRRFRDWYGEGREVLETDPVPWHVARWPDSSWLKRFIKYMVETDRYFVYPRVSLTTNFGDPGTHFGRRDSMFQVPLLEAPCNFRFHSLDESVSVYDAHFEPTPATVDRMTDRFHGVSYEVDLYRSKELEKVKADYLLTRRACSGARQRFGAHMTPMVMNAVHGIEGEDIAFCPVGAVTERKARTGREHLENPTVSVPGQACRAPMSARQALFYAVRKALMEIMHMFGKGGRR